MIQRFLKFVEIQTKITSLYTFALIIGVMIYHDLKINWLTTMVFFAGMFVFDLTTTAINNTIDTKHHGHYEGFTSATMKKMCYALLAISIALGLWLVALTDFVVLALGAFCFAVGIVYTYGPVPISRTPLGELLSGVLYGYFIPFILIYINLGADFFNIQLGETIAITLNTRLFVGFLIVGLVPTLLTSNIMLGNNTCDVEADVAVNRYTLPFYIGKQNAWLLMRALYVLTFFSIILGFALGVYHPLVLLTVITSHQVMKNVNVFKEEMVKHISFINVIKSFILVMTVQTSLVYISLFF